MLHRFLNIYPAVQNSINISNFIKNKSNLFFDKNNLKTLEQCHDILKIFMKSTIILQGAKYCSISLIFLYIYQVSKKLNDKFNDIELVSIYFILLFVLFIYINNH